MRVHYPRTPHLPWSPGASADDVRVGGLAELRGREVVVTEKLDGENTTLYPDGLHARSLDSAHHPSRAWVKGLQGRIGPAIPAGWRVCGENLYARHSIAYRELDSWFYGFSVWDDQDRCLDWDSTVRLLRRLGVPAPRVLWRGAFDERALRGLRLDTERQEGYVVRTVEGFGRAQFGERVAKWVRPRHVQTDAHWMHAAVVENGLGPAAALWAVRSGAAPDAAGLLAALGLTDPAGAADPAHSFVPEVAGVAEVADRLDALGCSGEARLAGVLAVLLHQARRPWLAARLIAPLGLPAARRVADLVGLHPGLRRPYPDEERRAGLVRLSLAANLGMLHAVAATVPGTAAERAEVEWSALHAEDAGLLGEAPLHWLRSGLREVLADLDPDAADRCWAEAREAYARGRIGARPSGRAVGGPVGRAGRGRSVGGDRSGAVEEAVAACWRWRSGEFPRLIQLVGPSGSGKSSFAAQLPGVDDRLSLDELREARGSRADQRQNGDVLREGLDRLDSALAAGRTVVWDATSLNQHQRSLVQVVAQRRDALVTHAVLLVEEAELARRNASRPHPVPPEVLTAQLHRFTPPYPGQAHRTWYVGPDGTVGDTAGTLGGPGEGGSTGEDL
ncbi:RNA ligase family protein [Kitasatospora azatica]|uniref:RNA ligase family protein n=1 Tax=Kitasatospora azatica TaxID=58347 RepID=UPI0005689EC6|nr:RNA ligase family protein [Kitasatospora azatica]